ncbi:hypothetical protein A2425_02410 [candidate division WWE3 bacterium RIFOXYC1_FULL_42_17]|uniref:Glycosyltransferase RgtA/B/C/D-like domain-containing protein n=1 Tax=candidate division WWE3 bacterium RIFOXYB1_FULL_42_27 TaxID=1802638 RepID=A0A1F4W0Y5_UNCKA|nr:MAG: hypothetical protein A2200_01310 [candidate division WWE3 bacterium RIFOXYA1_FULL_41_11]OGC63020.1 MAG: hypothetical protein A2399_00465 [candidate division WWE3 bacterium RIFOXYB1_FULL_42_27]OGC71688.1 MAG: hypothetical protein A2578_03605 [candidate division WWE3 bacterium RIFOXYD1_FULL_42_24]OGC75596.1 MAG: hypothetical protein A2425_02410 [candidate division WWE3 bacterium RIFOXYC1_FULL_42_17]
METIKNRPWVLYILILPIVAWSVVYYLLPQFSDVKTQDPEHPSDFLMYLTGATIVREGKISNLYDYETQRSYQRSISGTTPTELITGVLAFRTPPTTAWLYSLLPVQDSVKSFWIVVFINSVCIVTAIYLLSGSLIKTCVYSTAVTFFLSFWMTLIGGHPNGLLLLIMVLAYTALKNKRPGVAGIITGFLFLKPTFLLLVPFMFLLTKDKKQLFSYAGFFLLTILFLIGVNTAIFGPRFVQTYIPYLINSENSSYGTDISNNTNLTAVMYTVQKWLGSAHSTWIPIGVVVALNIFSLLAIYKKRLIFSPAHGFGLICLLLPLLNLHTMHADLLVHLIPLILIVGTLVKNKRWLLAVILAIVLIILPWYSLADLEWLVTLVILGLSFLLLNNLKWLGNQKTRA